MVNTERWRHRGPRAWTGAECGESGEWRVHSSDDRFLGGQPAPALPAPLPRASCTLQPSPPAQLTRMWDLQMCRKLLILVGRHLEFMWFLFVYFTCSMSIHFLNLNVHKSQQGRGSLNSQIEKFDVQTTEPITVSALSRLTRVCLSAGPSPVRKH